MANRKVIVEWDEPPDNTGVYEPLFEELRKYPGEWAVFKRGVPHPGGFVTKLRDGKYKGIRRGELEVRQVPLGGNDGYSIYIRVKMNERGST